MENWKKIDGYNYEVSIYGDVRNLKTEHVLKPRYNSAGYVQVGLYDDNHQRKNFLVHRLVGEAFIPNPDNKPQIDHINSVRDDNRVENLRWVTNVENCNTTHFKQAKGKPVRCIETDKSYFSITEAGERTGISSNTIGKACNGKSRTAGGLHWEFLPTPADDIKNSPTAQELIKLAIEYCEENER